MKLSGVGQRIAEARASALLTQNEVSIALDVTIGTVQAWEYERAALTLRRAAELAELYGVSIDHIATGESPRREDPRIRKIREIVS